MLESTSMKEELGRERALRRAAEASDEDSGFLRQQMETMLKEKAFLAQENARLQREIQTLTRELDIANDQLKIALKTPKKLKEVVQVVNFRTPSLD